MKSLKILDKNSDLGSTKLMLWSLVNFEPISICIYITVYKYNISDDCLTLIESLA